MSTNQLPSVLQAPKGNSISMERALKQILNLLENYTDNIDDDVIQASIDDVRTMLASINRD
jgi:hypothetical protein